MAILLYIVLFLHQTATVSPLWTSQAKLYIVLFLHQTATTVHTYIGQDGLYIVLFLHQTATLFSKLPLNKEIQGYWRDKKTEVQVHLQCKDTKKVLIVSVR